MNTGKCPHCKQTVEKALIEIIEPDTQATRLFGAMPRGLAFVCPNPQCRVILAIIPMPQAEQRKP
jgi:hypothetical protein